MQICFLLFTQSQCLYKESQTKECSPLACETKLYSIFVSKTVTTLLTYPAR